MLFGDARLPADVAAVPPGATIFACYRPPGPWDVGDEKFGCGHGGMNPAIRRLPKGVWGG